MTKDCSNYKKISIDTEKHPRALDIIDTWKKRGVNFSDKALRGIEKIFDEEEKGNKIDQYIEPVELVKMPRINQELKSEDIQVITENLTYEDFYKLCMVMESNLNLMLHAKRSPSTTYKKPLRV